MREGEKQRVRRSPAFLVGLGCALAACSQGPDPAELAVEGVSWELAEFRRQTIRDLEYQFALRVPETASDPVEGSVLIRFHWQDEERRPLIFDFLHPEERVSEVRVGGTPVSHRSVNDHLVVEVSTDVPPGPVEVAIDFIAGDESLNRGDDFLYALFVPERARYSLPLFDQPNLKARFALFLDLPRGWTAMANGRQIREEAGVDRRRFQFAPSDPLPTYLFTFVAGEFQKVTRQRGGRVLEFLHRETDEGKVERNLDRLLDLHAAALDWLEAYTGIPYPFQKFGFAAIPAFQYGGMEHPGAVFYRASRLFLEESATQAEHLARASLIAHETAHMWFGDLVTMNWFDDVWTKEVFANFMAAKIVHPSFPEVNHDLRFLLAHHPLAYDVDRSRGPNPIRQPLANLEDAGTLYGAIIYQKAPVVMRQLELLVGAEVFREGVREYLGAFSYGNATWPDLIAILDAASGEDLDGWSRVWVEEAGRPTVWVDGRGTSGRAPASLTLRQSDPADEGRVWPQNLSLALGHGGEMSRVPVRLHGESLPVPGAAGGNAPDFVLPDGWGEGYALFRLDEGTRRFLLAGLPEIRDPVVRGSAWLGLWDGVLEGEVQPREMMELALRALAREEEEQLLERILADLRILFWTLLPEEDRAAWAPEVEEALWKEVESAGNASPTSSLFRAYRDLAYTPGAAAILEEVWRGVREVPGLPLSEADRMALASALAVREVEGWEGILDTQLVSIDNPDRRAEFEFLRRSLDADTLVREAFFRDLRDPRNREKEPWVLAGLENLHHPLRREHSVRFILPGLELLEEIQRTGDIFFPTRWAAATLISHNSREAAGIVEAFLGERPRYPYQLRRKILQAADPLFRATDILSGAGT